MKRIFATALMVGGVGLSLTAREQAAVAPGAGAGMLIAWPVALSLVAIEPTGTSNASGRGWRATGR